MPGIIFLVEALSDSFLTHSSVFSGMRYVVAWQSLETARLGGIRCYIWLSNLTANDLTAKPKIFIRSFLTVP